MVTSLIMNRSLHSGYYLQAAVRACLANGNEYASVQRHQKVLIWRDWEVTKYR